MLISKTWLKKYIPDIANIEDDVIADKMTRSLAEVESIRTSGQGLNKLVVGKIINFEKHPQADKLNVCQVDVGFDKLQIVCGANNLVKDAKVVVCVPGGTVYNAKGEGENQGVETVEIKQVKIREVESNGMICSERELGISDAHEGILILPENYKPGEEIDDLLKDTIFEIENKSLTHRGDCFSHLGIARELAAIFDINFQEPGTAVDPVQTESLPIEVHVESDKVYRYLTITVKDIKVQQSPFWLKNVLRSIGIRSINNIVDISNYMMHDIGQPMHIYDYREIKDNKLIVREARNGESFTAIDNKKYTLNQGDLIIADNKDIHGLAGVIGGKRSEVSNSTQDILIEAAIFDSVQILKSSRQLGITTEASTRFSKGVDPEATMDAIKACVNIIIDMAQGEVASEILDVNTKENERKIINFNLQEVKRLTGQNIVTSETLKYLDRLGLVVKNRQTINPNESIITAPIVAEVEIPMRRRDLKEQVDLVEEVIRLFGYNRITPVAPTGSLKSRMPNPISTATRKLRSLMIREGFEELVNYSFISEESRAKLQLKESELIKITNAISPELKYVRNNLIVSLYETYLKNYKQEDNLNFFEIGRITDKSKLNDDKLPDQPWRLGALSGGKVNQLLNLKGKLLQMLDNYGIDSNKLRWREYREEDNPFLANVLHPFRRSTAVLGEIVIGVAGDISPILIPEQTEEKISLSVAELDIITINEISKDYNKKFTEISRLQSMSRDISFWINDDTAVGGLYRLINKRLDLHKDTMQTKLEVVDEYSEENKKSITLRIHIQPMSETLSRNAVNDIINEIITEITTTAGVEVR